MSVDSIDIQIPKRIPRKEKKRRAKQMEWFVFRRRKIAILNTPLNGIYNTSIVQIIPNTFN